MNSQPITPTPWSPSTQSPDLIRSLPWYPAAVAAMKARKV